jgi:thymidylate kinase
MKIGICSTQNNGKTTLVKSFLENWKMFKTPEKTYRDIIQEKGLNINKEGDVAGQTAIRDALFEQAHDMSHTHIIEDRTILCNLVYTLYLVEKDKIEDDSFVADSIMMCRDAMKKYDVIFWLPLNPDIKMDESNPNRDQDETYRYEIDVIFQSVYKQWLEQKCVFFDADEQPPIIPLEGNLVQKIQEIQEYIGPDGEFVQEEQSVLATLEEEFTKLQLMKELEAEMKV